jgi:hypothetical protein
VWRPLLSCVAAVVDVAVVAAGLATTQHTTYAMI